MQIPPRIYLVGFMGCGKTHIGKYLAQSSGYRFLDLDEYIEAREGCSVAEIFLRHGEDYFRYKEREALHLTAGLEQVVIACGGGTPCFFDNAQWINAHGLAVFLDIPLPVLASRLEKEREKRPLLNGVGPSSLEMFIEERLDKRRAFYQLAALSCSAIEAEVVLEAIRQWCSDSTSFVGIDFGSKLAGTTAIAYYDAGSGYIQFLQSVKGKDADAFLLEHFSLAPWKTAFLDAPLSLPKVYTDPTRGSDYFMREADKQAKAMSPMFLGGLTARAIRIKAKLREAGVQTIEVYPGKLATTLGFDTLGYKQKTLSPALLVRQVQEILPYPVSLQGVENWHIFDALLAFTTGWRFKNGIHALFGDSAEGQIII